ncbi:MAG TPA: exosortase family protein XrtF [Cyclobacteriaceae bacterium]|nr:exosortase family protein XrtF [Cyclobacteriaceae bacterium]
MFESLKEFKPSIYFLLRFLGVYVAGNLLYGLYVESFGDDPDPLTHMVTYQTARCLQNFGFDTTARDNTQGPTVFLETDNEIVLGVYEGCNGLNVMIVFVAFMVAFGGPVKKMLWFIPAGLLIIHIFNLGRISLLYFVAQRYEEYFYLFHKYFFTAIIYIVVFLLWTFWVLKIVDVRSKPLPNASE